MALFVLVVQIIYVKALQNLSSCSRLGLVWTGLYQGSWLHRRCCRSHCRRRTSTPPECIFRSRRTGVPSGRRWRSRCRRLTTRRSRRCNRDSRHRETWAARNSRRDIWTRRHGKTSSSKRRAYRARRCWRRHNDVRRSHRRNPVH